MSRYHQRHCWRNRSQAHIRYEHDVSRHEPIPARPAGQELAGVKESIRIAKAMHCDRAAGKRWHLGWPVGVVKQVPVELRTSRDQRPQELSGVVLNAGETPFQQRANVNSYMQRNGETSNEKLRDDATMAIPAS